MVHSAQEKAIKQGKEWGQNGDNGDIAQTRHKADKPATEGEEIETGWRQTP